MSDNPAVGIPIGAAEFHRLVELYIARMDSGDAMTVDDFITMTRLWNTIEQTRLHQREGIYRQYYAALFPGWVLRIEQAIGASPTKGMALYSRDHDLYFGGKLHANSCYRIQGPTRD